MIVPLRSNAITYGWENAVNGKNFVVRIPARALVSDRIAILTWLREFAEQIRVQEPFWIVRLHSFTGGYFLNVVPTDGIEDFVRHHVEMVG
jgi:hypothetical protein